MAVDHLHREHDHVLVKSAVDKLDDKPLFETYVRVDCFVEMHQLRDLLSGITNSTRFCQMMLQHALQVPLD